jgi:hypothetical protein
VLFASRQLQEEAQDWWESYKYGHLWLPNFLYYLKIDKFDLNMHLFVHSNLGNNKFCEIKINHKVSNSLMLLHFIVMSGFC